ncbi:MAG: hypothetical protein JWM44_4325 [Bacilli bacterium]|nr:hypothetical protein [Bacilli bacterium]
MRSLVVGNGINIQFGGYENTNESILIRAIKSVKEDDFPRNLITADTDDIISLIGHLFLEVQLLLKDGYEKYTISSDEKDGLKDLKLRYLKYRNLKLTDIGFEDYYLIYDLFCHKKNINNPEKFHVREGLKSFFLHSIYNKGKVNKIHKKYSRKLTDFFLEFNNIFTTNYDKNIESFINRKVHYLHGAFHIKADIYNPDSFRNKLSDNPMKDYDIENNYYYLYSNALTTYSGYSKNFSINMAGTANIAVEKFAMGYISNPTVKKDVDSWKGDKNIIVNNLYESIMLKINNPELKFEENYPISDFITIEDEFSIVGLSPNNDTHIFDMLNNNDKLKSGDFYYYNKNEINTVNKLLSNISMNYYDVKELWGKYK